MRTEAGKVSGSLIFPIRNGHGASNDRSGISPAQENIYGLMKSQTVNLLHFDEVALAAGCARAGYGVRCRQEEDRGVLSFAVMILYAV